jgi:hypothetical protein
MVPGVQVRLAEIRRGWVRKFDGFVSTYVHSTERVEAVFVGGRPGVPDWARWQLVGDARHDGRIFGRLASALRAVPAPAMAFGSGKRLVRSI